LILTIIAMLNFDCQVRFRWEAGSIAIWDNRSTWHSATFDYAEERAGERASSVGERPYFDPKSTLKSEGLAREGNRW
jgi:alpha-ketoglutarate-dependent taurine dioxygenase